MTAWPFSILAESDERITHAAGVVEAANHDEAVGRATRIARRLYPLAAGWDTDVVVNKDREPIDPNHVVIASEE